MTLSSVSELPQIISALQEIDVMIGKLEVKTETLRTKAGHAKGTLRECEYIFFRISSLLSRMGLPPEMDAAIDKMRQMLLVVRILHSAIIVMQSGTPYGVIIGLVTLFGAEFAAYDMMRGH